jgi:hypothetical protein
MKFPRSSLSVYFKFDASQFVRNGEVELSLRNIIFTSFIVVLFITGACVVFTSSKPTFEDGVLDFGVFFTYFGLIQIVITKFSFRYQNDMRYFKKRLELEEEIGGMSGKDKIKKEIKLLVEGKFHGQKSWITTRRIKKFESMSLEKAREIGSEPKLKKLRRSIRLAEVIMPFVYKVILISGIALILIHSI